MIRVVRDNHEATRLNVQVREHTFVADMALAEGGQDAGPDPHDLHDSALGACKALTVLWYARRKGIAVGDVEVLVERDRSREREGRYQLTATLAIGGDISDAQRAELLAVAEKCPVHKLMTEVTTEILTRLA
jgi:putative redox protein